MPSLSSVSTNVLTSLALAAASALAGPADFGQQELRLAIAAKGVQLTVATELNTDAPETFHITAVEPQTVRISGGDLRGLMYGLIEASEQIRGNGNVQDMATEGGMRLRSVRLAPADADIAQPRFFSTDRWTIFFQQLARHRINRLTLVLPPEQWESERLRALSTLAKDYAVDFYIGVRTTPANRALAGHLRKMLDQCVLVRGVQMDVGRETVDFFKAAIFPAFKQSGRRVTLDLRGVDARPDVLRAAQTAAIPLEIASRTTAAALGRRYYAVVAAASVPTDTADQVRARIESLSASGATGFEVDLAGPNFDVYERVYWAWGRQGYLYRPPTLAVAKPIANTKKKADAKAKSKRK
jgi:hypothetical protein